MKLINSDRLKRVLNKNFGGIGGAAVLKQLIDNQPTVDTVSMVHCENCKYYEPDGFCSYGERKDE